MSYSSMDFGAMQQAYAAFQQKYNQMNSELDDLARSVESKLGQWEDGARDAYFDAKRQWEASAAEPRPCPLPCEAPWEELDDAVTVRCVACEPRDCPPPPAPARRCPCPSPACEPRDACDACEPREA